jgi:hypothetical protein
MDAAQDLVSDDEVPHISRLHASTTRRPSAHSTDTLLITKFTRSWIRKNDPCRGNKAKRHQKYECISVKHRLFVGWAHSSHLGPCWHALQSALSFRGRSCVGIVKSVDSDDQVHIASHMLTFLSFVCPTGALVCPIHWRMWQLPFWVWLVSI